jgi:hypothetical protein
MLPGRMVNVHPLSLAWYVRGSQGTGALPTANQALNTPIISTIAGQVNGYMNPADGTEVLQDLVGTSDTAIQRYMGQYYATVFLYQDTDATLYLQERTLLRLLDPTGATDQMKTVQTRVIHAGVPFRETYMLMNAETRFRYVNSGSNTSVFDWSVILRPL